VAIRRTGSLESLRERNRRCVIEILSEHHLLSRAEIARRTGLSRSTVSSLVTELQREGLVIEREEEATPPQSGRPPVLLSLDPNAGAVLGLHFDHPIVRVAVADLEHRILAEARLELDVDHDADTTLEASAGLVEQVLCESAVDRDHVLGAGLALAGPLDSRTGRVGSATILPGWVGRDIATELSRRIGLPVHVDNDANLGALGELMLGAGRGATEMAYIMLSSGIGAGLILGGRVYRGARGVAGEIGHVPVDEHGDICRCGNRGCLETFVGAHALLELLRRSHADGLTVGGMVQLAREGDLACQRALADAGRIVGKAAAALCNQFNPERIVVGGELALAGDVLLDPLRDAIGRYALRAAAEEVEVVQGALGERAELMGALVFVVGQSDRAFSGRLRAAVGR
jgi:predicted NBD/HSP70 family sugar kinase